MSIHVRLRVAGEAYAVPVGNVLEVVRPGEVTPVPGSAAGLRLVHNGEVKLITLLKAMSARPAELLGLTCGALRPGSPADVIVVDVDDPWVLDPAELKSKCKNTPFDEARLQGRVVRTIVAGRTVFEYV